MTTGTAAHGVVKSIIYPVPGSKAGVIYQVVADPRDGRVLFCTCPDHQNRRRECKHMKLVSRPDHGGIKPRLRYGPANEATIVPFAIIRSGDTTVVRPSKERERAASAPTGAVMSDFYAE